ncbi:MAG TPA: serine hydrolase domain-containing protein [Acidimicrobiia bacterium]|nr:serine hydrolase domain-containing protein [Acidimicrobiia bacterium]
MRTPIIRRGAGDSARVSSWRRRVPLGILLVVILLVPAPGMAADDSEFEALLGTRMPALLDQYGVPGSVVSFIENGNVVWTTAYGMADLEAGTAMSTDMVFEFGSCGKILTAWATMKLVEQGAIDLDGPVNDYLDRLQIESDIYDPSAVTVRRLLSHTSGLGIHGYVDYSPRRANPPDSVETLQGPHLLEGIVETLAPGGVSFGRIEVVQEPGSGYRYSGAGYGVLQVLIEDVTGEPFDSFVKREITDPLGATSLQWAWTPELEARSPTPYGEEGQTMEYRQLTIHGIGSEVGTVEDFARFVAATAGGPNGEPPGRGVLSPETIDRMTAPASEAGFYQGLGYPLGSLNGHRSVSHGGRNMGWEAFFILDTVTGDGFVVASASNRAGPLHSTITNLFLDTAYGAGTRITSAPLPRLELFSWVFLAISLVLLIVLVAGLIRFVRDVRSGRRARVPSPSWRSLMRGLPWLLALLFGWYTLYSPWPLYLPAWFPDLWPTAGSAVLMGILATGFAFRIATAFFPRRTGDATPVPDAPTAEIESRLVRDRALLTSTGREP